MTVNVNQQLWDTANKLPTIDIFSRPGLLASDASGTLSICSDRNDSMGNPRRFCAGSFLSKVALSFQVSIVGSNTASAQTNRAVRQPASTTTRGTNSPAIMPPSGTPACLMENTRLRIPGGENRCSTSLPAGLEAPML